MAYRQQPWNPARYRAELHGVRSREILMGLAASITFIAVVAGIFSLFVYLGATWSRVMRYHDIATPRIVELSHGTGGGGGGSGEG